MSAGGGETPSSTSRPKQWRTKALTKLNAEKGTMISMFKGALPPTISLAIYQSTSAADRFSTLGYLVAIASILAFAILPRAKFIQNMLLNVFGICIGSCIALLTIYSSTQARRHTTPPVQPTSNGPTPGAKVTVYNSSASVVSAIWLFFNIWLANAMRASRPQLVFPVILYNIFASIASVYAPIFSTMTAGIAFVKRLIEVFMVGFAIATGVSLFIFPMSFRGVIFKQTLSIVDLLKAGFAAELEYLKSLEREDMFCLPKEIENQVNADQKSHLRLRFHRSAKPEIAISPETEKVKQAIRTVSELVGKMVVDLTFAKREMAYGKLNADDIVEISKHLRIIVQPMVGVASAAEIFKQMAERKGWTKSKNHSEKDNESSEDDADAEILAEKRQWNQIMRTVHRSFEAVAAAMNEGLDHAMYRLEIAKRPKGKRKDAMITPNGSVADDVEAQADKIKPGDDGFANYLSTKVSQFDDSRKGTLAEFCKLRNIRLDELGDFSASDVAKGRSSKDTETRERNQRQLFLLLEMEYLLWSTGQAVLDLVTFSDRKVSEGAMKQRRFIFPGKRRLTKWFMGLFKEEDSGTEHSPDSAESGGVGIHAGKSYEAAKDPEHLPPTNAWQQFSTGLRSIGEFLGSPESGFGFRAACATMSIGIIAYLKDTQTFFLEQRLIWAMIMVAIGMTTTAGSGIFGFLGRIAGTTLAMCVSIVIWYIVDGKTAGVLVFFFIFSFFEMIILLKFPRLVIIAIISIVTQTLIVGYELQVRKVGLQQATSNGQPFYAIYLLAPYRLACVTAGMAVAFIWTMFPYPLTARSQLRKDLALALYLLANFYSIVHTTANVRVNGIEDAPARTYSSFTNPHPNKHETGKKATVGYKLSKARTAVFAKEMSLLAGLRQHSAFTAWEPTFGGKFPRETYDSIIESTTRILQYLSLMAYVSTSFIHDDSDTTPTDSFRAPWIADFSSLVGRVRSTTQEVTSVLALLSASVRSGSALPPYMKVPRGYELTRWLEKLDPEILAARHVQERGYSAFAVMQIASRCIGDEMAGLIENVKLLVGEVDFSFHIHSTSTSSEETLYVKEAGGKGKKE